MESLEEEKYYIRTRSYLSLHITRFQQHRLTLTLQMTFLIVAKVNVSSSFESHILVYLAVIYLTLFGIFKDRLFLHLLKVTFVSWKRHL